jgi:hypothetical protein
LAATSFSTGENDARERTEVLKRKPSRNRPFRSNKENSCRKSELERLLDRAFKEE